jgi:predicted nucleic acid-binding protein
LKVAFDTNVLAYAEGVNGALRKQEALAVVAGLPADAVALPVQTLGELFNVLTRKAGRSAVEAHGSVLAWRDAFPLIATTPMVLMAAVDLAMDHRFAIWDAIILAATAEAECRLLLSEDLQDGFTWRGVTVTNPFVSPRHVLLDALLADHARPGASGPT